MASQLKEQFMKDVKAFAESKYPGDEDDENLEIQFITNLAGDYYEGAINQTKLFEEFASIAEEQEQRNHLIKTIQTFKAKHMPKPPKAEQKKAVEKKTAPQTKPEKKTEVRSEKAKIFQRIEGAVDQPSKKVKKDEKGEENGEQEVALKQNLKKKLETEGKQKCKFFPYCKNEETCEYFHPTQKV